MIFDTDTGAGRSHCQKLQQRCAAHCGNSVSPRAYCRAEDSVRHARHRTALANAAIDAASNESLFGAHNSALVLTHVD